MVTELMHQVRSRELRAHVPEIRQSRSFWVVLPPWTIKYRLPTDDILNMTRGVPEGPFLRILEAINDDIY